LAAATELVREDFPYTAVYPALGNLDLFPSEEEAPDTSSWPIGGNARGRHGRGRRRRPERRDGKGEAFV